MFIKKIKPKLLIAITFTLILSSLTFGLSFSSVDASPSPTPISFTSGVGQRLLDDAEYNDDYWLLKSNYEHQETNTYCGVASTVIALNALQIEKPRQGREKGDRWTQQQFAHDVVNRFVSKEAVGNRGIRLTELQRILRTLPVQTNIYWGNKIDPTAFRSLLKKSLVSSDHIVIVNYHREAVGQQGSGHYSPLAAYNAHEDKVLILDVSRGHYRPAWVDVDKLLVAMKSRGCVVLQKTA